MRLHVLLERYIIAVRYLGLRASCRFRNAEALAPRLGIRGERNARTLNSLDVQWLKRSNAQMINYFSIQHLQNVHH